ncbi:MAG: hypothetical protein ACHBN1_19820 [Heteroscytonema crispum UTEX LB 1556]
MFLQTTAFTLISAAKQTKPAESRLNYLTAGFNPKADPNSIVCGQISVVRKDKQQ